MWIPQHSILSVNDVEADLLVRKRRLNMLMKLGIRRSDKYQLKRIRAWMGLRFRCDIGLAFRSIMNVYPFSLVWDPCLLLGLLLLLRLSAYKPLHSVVLIYAQQKLVRMPLPPFMHF